MQIKGDSAAVSPRWGTLGVLAIATALSVHGTAAGGIVLLHVDDDAPQNGDGLTWASAFRDLQSALDAVNTLTQGEVEVRVAGGTYPARVPGTNLDRAFTLRPLSVVSAQTVVSLGSGGDGCGHDVDHGAFVSVERAAPAGAAETRVFSLTVRVLGGFAGIGSAAPDTRDPVVHATRLSGGDETGPGEWPFVRPSVLDVRLKNYTDAMIDGFSFPPAGTGTDRVKVAMVCDPRSRLVLDRLEASGGAASAIEGWAQSVELRRSKFAENRVGGQSVVRLRSVGPGGQSDTGIAISDCVFTDNFVLDYQGSSLFVGGSVVDVKRCVFERNSGGDFSGWGWYTSGAMYAFGDRVTVADSRFADNLHIGPENPGYLAGSSGALHILGGGPQVGAHKITGCVFERNRGPAGAGAVSFTSDGDSIEIRDCDLTGNSGARGGAVAIVRNAWSPFTPSAVIESCEFLGNRATGEGGAVCAAGPLSVKRSGFAGGIAGEAGGAIAAHGSLVVARCDFVGNSARTNGGAIVAEKGAELKECAFLDNFVESSTEARGGAISSSSKYEWLVVESSRFLGNRAVSAGRAFGGALDSPSPLTRFRSVLLAGNHAEGVTGAGGGALFFVMGADLYQCTVAHNSAGSANGPALGGGVAVGFGDIEFTYGIAWGNTDDRSPAGGSGLANLVPGYAVDMSTCLVQGLPPGFDALGNSGNDPQFRNPAGADGLHGTPDDDYRLGVSSPAIDRVSQGCGGTDALLQERCVGAPNIGLPGDYTSDVGAVECAGDEGCTRFILAYRRETLDTLTVLIMIDALRGGVAYDTRADFNEDGVVDTHDLVMLLGRFGCTRWPG